MKVLFNSRPRGTDSESQHIAALFGPSYAPWKRNPSALRSDDSLHWRGNKDHILESTTKKTACRGKLLLNIVYPESNQRVWIIYSYELSFPYHILLPELSNNSRATFDTGRKRTGSSGTQQWDIGLRAWQPPYINLNSSIDSIEQSSIHGVLFHHFHSKVPIKSFSC